jgi:excisionase family DNA binding protein
MVKRMVEQKRAPSELLTVEQVAAYLRLNKLTVYRYIRLGDLRAVRIGRVLRVRRTDVYGFLEAHKVRPAAPPQPAAAEPGQQARLPVPAGTPAEFGEPADVLEERRQRQVLLSSHPLEWVIRGLH